MHRFLFALSLVAAASGCTKQQFASPVSPLAVAAETAEAPPQVAAVPAPDLVQLDASTTNRYVTAGAPSEVVARLRIVTQAQADTPRPDANVALVIDTSGSMRGAAIEQARAAALTMLDSLHAGDRLTLVVFHSKADVLVPTTEITPESRATIRKAIEGMTATGTTALAEGLSLGLSELSSYAHPDRVSRIVLLSDGVPNVDASIRDLAAHAAAQSISITALGLGVDYQETLLADIASLSGGRFHFIEDADQVAAMFRDEVLHIERLVALGSQLTLSPGPGVTITEVLGRPHAFQARALTVRIGDLAEDETKDIIVRMQVGEHRDGATVELFDASLSYADAVAGAGVLQRDAFLAVEATDDGAKRLSGIDVEAELVAAKAITAAETLRIVARARAGDIKGAMTQLEAAEKQARVVATKSEDPALTALADELAALRKTIPDLAPPPPPKPATLSKTGAKGEQVRLPEPFAIDIGGAVMPTPAGSQDGLSEGTLQRARDLKRSHSNAFNALH